MHCHTCIASKCGHFTPEELVKTYHTQGFTGVIVTEHFFNGNCAVDNSLPWAERVEAYCRAYELVKEEGDKVGLDVFFGFEYSATNATFCGGKIPQSDYRNSVNGTDFIILGLDKDWLLSKTEDILNLSVNDFLKMARTEGGFVIQAHPFRLARSYMDHISLFPEYTDAVETLNSSPNTMGRANKLAAAYAKQYNFYRTAGSDAHGNDREYFAVLKTKDKAKTVNDLVRSIKDGTIKLGLKKNKYF
jgi:hypothetical protein